MPRCRLKCRLYKFVEAGRFPPHFARAFQTAYPAAAPFRVKIC
ncbi:MULTISPECIES: hypothetical protein [Neisseria]|nr:MULTISPECIES: hypothetical protein [Neisseria]